MASPTPQNPDPTPVDLEMLVERARQQGTAKGLKLAAQALRKALNEIDKELAKLNNLSAPSAQDVASAEKLKLDLLQPIDELALTTRTYNFLVRNDIRTIGDLVARSEIDLLDIRNFGVKSLDEVKTKLDQMGLSLTDDLARPIEDLDFSARAYNPLWRAGIRTVGDLVKWSEQELASLKGLGPSSIDEITTRLASRTGLMLKGDSRA